MSLFLAWFTTALAATPVTAAPKCPEAPLLVAQATSSQLEMAYFQADETAFAQARWSLELAVPCIDGEVSLSDAVVLHRARAITAFVDGDLERSRRSFAAVRAVQPGWTPSPALMPEGHPLRDLWEEAAAIDVSSSVDLPPNAGGWNIDGGRATSAPGGRAFVLQAFAPDGDTLLTRYCERTDCLEEAEKIAVGLGATRKELAGRRVRTIGTTAGALLVSGGVVGFLIAGDARRDLVGASDEEVIGLEGRARTGRGVGIGGTVAGVAVVGASWTLTW